VPGRAGCGDTIPLKETLDLPDPTWLQFRRRFDKLEPFCRIASHTSEEVREILATLETVYQPLFPQLNLRQWAGTIYTWLTHPVLDPTHSGRVTMDNLMKLVTTALEWTYEASETDVRAERLKSAAELLVLRHDTLKLIDGAGPSIEAPPPEDATHKQASGTEAQQDSSSNEEQKIPPVSPPGQVDQARSRKKEASHATASPKCTFFGVVPIDINRYLSSGVTLVECPSCACTRTLEPHGGVLRFKSHNKRKTTTPNTGQRWSRGEGETDWNVVGGEGK
jgi:hypothetical protein